MDCYGNINFQLPGFSFQGPTGATGATGSSGSGGTGSANTIQYSAPNIDPSGAPDLLISLGFGTYAPNIPGQTGPSAQNSIYWRAPKNGTLSNLYFAFSNFGASTDAITYVSQVYVATGVISGPQPTFVGTSLLVSGITPASGNYFIANNDNDTVSISQGDLVALVVNCFKTEGLDGNFTFSAGLQF